MSFEPVLKYAHQLIKNHVAAGDTVIDATVGNGHDTLFLARQVGRSGLVYGFDIQPWALEKARERLLSAGIIVGDASDPGIPMENPPDEGPIHESVPNENVRLFPYNHASMLDVLPQALQGNVAAVMFNLGYLPGGDHRHITTADFTLQALEAAVRLVKPGGIITLVVYTGHEGGQKEADAVGDWAMKLPQERFTALQYRFINQRNHPPFLLAVEKT